MNREEYYKPCTKCGRPQTYCRGECCGTPKCKTDTCIRYGKPGCGCDAVIPTATVATKADIKGLTNCFVHVADTNTTFYVDDKGAAIETWAGLASVNNYDFDANPLNFRNQIVYDYDADKAAIYNQWGDHAEFPIGVTPESYNWLTEKPSINGVTLQGNKSLDDLGISSAISTAAAQATEDAVDEMIEKTALVFDTVADMKASTDLVDGSCAHTLGYHTKNDGGASLYKVRTLTNDDVIDEGSIIALADNTLVAELIVTNGVVTPEQFGAYGDGVHDDVLAIRNALKYCLSTDNTVTTWQTANELKLLDKTYLISDSIIDSTFPASATRIAITGSGTRTGIVAGENCEIVINNVNKIGFSNFKDINFIGNDNTFLFENGSQPQRLRFIRCTFRNFHTICNIEGTVDSSEFVFNQCAVQNCGSVASPCVLFIFNNSQAVNWRFYATDIESFVGTCFKIKKGTSVNIFQGSIIPTGAGTIYDFSEADANSIGGGNKPTFTLYGVRYEMRDGAKLIYSTDYNGAICIEHICCGMGGQNIATDYAVIDITNAIPQLIFHSCWNLNNYKINMVLNRSVAAQYNNLGFFKFYNGEFEQITALANRSVFTTQNSSQAEMMAQLYYNDQNINKNNGDRVLNYAGQILNKNLTVISKSYSASSGEGVTYYMPKEGFVSNVTIESVYSASFGATATLIAEVYNANNTKIGEGTVLIQGREKAVIQVNAVVTTGWYVVLKHTYSNPTTLYIPHMLYAEYYS